MTTAIYYAAFFLFGGALTYLILHFAPGIYKTEVVYLSPETLATINRIEAKLNEGPLTVNETSEPKPYFKTIHIDPVIVLTELGYDVNDIRPEALNNKFPVLVEFANAVEVKETSTI